MLLSNARISAKIAIAFSSVVMVVVIMCGSLFASVVQLTYA